MDNIGQRHTRFLTLSRSAFGIGGYGMYFWLGLLKDKAGFSPVLQEYDEEEDEEGTNIDE